MARKLELKTIVQIERTKSGIMLKSDKRFKWRIENLPPDIAIAAVISNTLSKSLLYEDMFSKEYIIEMKIEHKQDE